MCGIAGFLAGPGFDCRELGSTAQAMADQLRHRGPDDSGIWTDAEAGLALAHRRLSIIDLSAAGHQPMVSPSGRYVLAYNGEIYNFQQLRADVSLCDDLPPWSGHSDTEVLLRLIEVRGVRFALASIRGMFAFALWDAHERTLTLARDRLGEKPLYYGRQAGSFVFGSELKALRAHPQLNAAIDRNALALYLRHSCVPAPYTIYEGIYKLPPGHLLVLTARSAEPVVDAYWSPRHVAEAGYRDQFAASEHDLTLELDTLLRMVVKQQMLADVPLGAFLSGGVDSSLVVALMQAQSGQPIRTFTIGFTERDYDEAVNAAAVARHLGTEHTELYLTPREAMDTIPRLPSIYDEPFADSSQIPTYLVSRLASTHVKVALSGDGGDELFGGYNRHAFAHRYSKSLDRVPDTLRSAAARMISWLSPRCWDALGLSVSRLALTRRRIPQLGEKLYKLADALAAADPDQRYRELVSQWKSPEQMVLRSHEPPTRLAELGSAAVDDPVARMMLFDLATYLPDDILVKLDRASMSVSLETRVPLLDDRVVEFAWRVPIAAKINTNGTKQLLRSVLRRYVPDSLIERPKMGFAVPIGDWLRGPLRQWADALLDPARLRQEGYLEADAVSEKWRQHLTGRHQWQHSLWSVLMFEAWLESVNGR